VPGNVFGDARHLISILCAAALVLGALGCGGDNGSGETSAEETRPTETEAAPEQPLSAEEQRGRELFVDNCGTCHTLEAAGTDGSIGPNLDEAQVDEQAVLDTIAEGPGQMPSNLVTGEDARAVAKFVANAGPGV
jgi:mono/diheme cytochrome c family protein